MIERLRRYAEALARQPFAVRVALPVVWAAMIWFLSSRSMTGGARGMALVFLFNGGHVVLFGTLALLLHFVLRSVGLRRVLLAVVLASLYGAVDEFHQSFVPGRQSSVFDWMSDTSGALLFGTALTWLRERYAWALRAAIVAVPIAAASVVLATLW